MYGREELKTYISCELYDKSSDEFKAGDAYLKDEADKVMDAMEARIKELEEANKRTQKHREEVESSESNIRQEMFKMESKIKELESIPHTDNTEVIDNLQKCIKELEEAISKMETTEPKWISVKDRLPPKGQHVLVVNNFRSLYPIDVVCWSEDYITHDIVTHWQPLPPPPNNRGFLGR